MRDHNLQSKLAELYTANGDRDPERVANGEYSRMFNDFDGLKQVPEIKQLLFDCGFNLETDEDFFDWVESFLKVICHWFFGTNQEIGLPPALNVNEYLPFQFSNLSDKNKEIIQIDFFEAFMVLVSMTLMSECYHEASDEASAMRIRYFDQYLQNLIKDPKAQMSSLFYAFRSGPQSLKTLKNHFLSFLDDERDKIQKVTTEIFQLNALFIIGQIKILINHLLAYDSGNAQQTKTLLKQAENDNELLKKYHFYYARQVVLDFLRKLNSHPAAQYKILQSLIPHLEISTLGPIYQTAYSLMTPMVTLKVRVKEALLKSNSSEVVLGEEKLIQQDQSYREIKLKVVKNIVDKYLKAQAPNCSDYKNYLATIAPWQRVRKNVNTAFKMRQILEVALRQGSTLEDQELSLYLIERLRQQARSFSFWGSSVLYRQLDGLTNNHSSPALTNLDYTGEVAQQFLHFSEHPLFQQYQTLKQHFHKADDRLRQEELDRFIHSKGQASPKKNQERLRLIAEYLESKSSVDKGIQDSEAAAKALIRSYRAG